MEDREMVVIQNSDGTSIEAELVTYLISDDRKSAYVVYSKGEITGVDSDEVIYISKIISKENMLLKIDEIKDDNEWLEVQNLLKRIANAS